ncbi:unnamed protein product [Rotaria magnacalcarata]|uniref:Uncharacterized protein n=1 Tax=Rotaria magnacalcarata TaxID=392030 RepID=A0A818XD38_9BILA|nr:unnamed protein product [Rotaria magnacalcarata]CAF3738766.1 unnamed protein product [Rotaria magnacalcarata]
MVDIIKILPPLSKPVASDIHRIHNRPTSRQITLPILFSTVTIHSKHDRTTTFNLKNRSTRRGPGDLHHQINVCDTQDSMHRALIDHEMARYYSGTTIDMSASIKIKQQQQQQQQQQQSQQQKNSSNREPFRAIIGSGTTVTSIPVITNVDARSSRLFDTLSKHFTIKAEPLRPVNNFVNNTTSTLYSWKKYWTSTEIQKRQNEIYDSDYILNDGQCDQTLLSTKDFVTFRDSSLVTNSGTHCRSRTSSSRSNSSTPIQVSSPIIPDKQTLHIDKESQFSSPQIILSNEKLIPRMDQSKYTEEKPSSLIDRNNSLSNDDDVELQEKIKKITTKMYRFPLPSNKPKTNTVISKHTLLKPLEKQPHSTTTTVNKKEPSTTSANTSIVKRKRQKTSDRKCSNKSNRTTTKKQQFISAVAQTVLKSKYERTKWDQPYVGIRKDPPTPPCSPSPLINSEDDNQDGKDTFLEQDSTNEVDV